MNWRAALSRARAFASALDRDGALARALVLASDRDLNLDLASALQVARTLANVLDLDRARVLDQARTLANDLVRALAGALDRDRAEDRDCALVRAAETAHDLASALDCARGGLLDSGYAPDRVTACGPDLSRALVSALVSYQALLRALASYPALDRDRDPAGDFARYRDVARDLACHLESHPTASVALVAGGARWMPGRVPHGLVMLAVWSLPRSWQQRYREELLSELAQLPPGERYAYAWQQLVKALTLCRALAGTECPPDRVRVEG